jgi:hypothetical protein
VFLGVFELLEFFDSDLALPEAEKLEITVMTPVKAMIKPTIPIGAVLLIIPANTVTNPRSKRATPLIIRFLEGVSGDAESADTRRGSSVKRAASISSRRRFSRSDSGTCAE